MANSIFITYLGPVPVTTSGNDVVFPGSVSGTRFLSGDGTKALPAFSFTAAPSWGFYRDNNFGLVASVADTDIWTTDSAALVLASSKSLLWGSATFATPDISVARAAARTFILGPTTGARMDWSVDGTVRFLAFGGGDTAIVRASSFTAGSSAGVTAGPFTVITGITVVGGIVTALTGS